MLVSGNKEKTVEMYKMLNTRNWDAFKNLISPTFQGPNGKTGTEAFIEPIRLLTSAFADARWEVKDILEEGGKVVVLQELTGSHTGKFQHYEATGKNISNSGIAIYYFKEGLITGTLLQNDRLGFLQQLGILPMDLQNLKIS